MLPFSCRVVAHRSVLGCQEQNCSLNKFSILYEVPELIDKIISIRRKQSSRIQEDFLEREQKGTKSLCF